MDTKKFKPPPEVAEFVKKHTSLARLKTGCRATEFILSFFVLAAVGVAIYNYDLLGLAGAVITIAMPIAIAIPASAIMERRLRRERKALNKWLQETKERLGKNALYTSGAVRTVGRGYGEVIKMLDANPVDRTHRAERERVRARDNAAFRAVCRLRVEV
ncbi:MAG: hypothetical protein WC457_03555 [Patescibacteria group bacterium]